MDRWDDTFRSNRIDELVFILKEVMLWGRGMVLMALIWGIPTRDLYREDGEDGEGVEVSRYDT